MSTLDTLTKVFSVFGCKGTPVHVHSGLTLLKAAKGYVCPTCREAVEDITDTPLGREYFRWLRPDLWRKSPAPPRPKT